MAGEVWLETWSVDHGDDLPVALLSSGRPGVNAPLGIGSMAPPAYQPVGADDVARAQLAAAAPDLARALLKVEWRGESRGCEVCVGCQVEAPYEPKPGEPHESDCFADAALTKAGFPTAERRDAARAAIDKAGL